MPTSGTKESKHTVHHPRPKARLAAPYIVMDAWPEADRRPRHRRGNGRSPCPGVQRALPSVVRH